MADHGTFPSSSRLCRLVVVAVSFQAIAAAFQLQPVLFQPSRGRDLSATVSTSTTSLPDLPEVVHKSLPLNKFAGQIEQALKNEFGEENIQRVLHCWRMLEADYVFKADVGHMFEDQGAGVGAGDESFRKQECHSYVPGLTLKEFWDADTEFDWAAKLASKYPALKREFTKVMSNPNALQQQGNNIWAGALTEGASGYGIGWKTLVLMDRGVWDPTNAKLFPVTAKAIQDCQVPAVEVFFASMEPNSEIKPHSDFTNFVLTSHLAMDIPCSGQNKCRLRIGDTTREWINGQVTVFDTSIFHDAVNESDLTRYILMMRVWHPDLSSVERQALQFIWDCLELPDLASSFPEARQQAQLIAAARREFPDLAAGRGGGNTGAKLGFGGGGAAGSSQKRKSKKK